MLPTMSSGYFTLMFQDVDERKGEVTTQNVQFHQLAAIG
jgi:hypothetical protein